MTLNGVMTVILRFFAEFGRFRGRLRQSGQDRPIRKCSPKNLVFSDISLMAILAMVTENERIIHRHLRDTHPLLNYDTSESQSMISI